MTLAVSTVAVTGATGYVGRFVVAELQRAGLGVRALARPHSALDGFSAPPEWCMGDLRDADSLRAFAQGADAVVHLAYEHVPGRYRGGEGADLPAWLDANLYGSLRLLTAAQAAGVKRFLFLSSRAVFSRTEPGRVLDESHPTSPDTHYGAYKAAVESFLWSFAHTSGMKSCAVRATGVYGLTWPVERSKWWGVVRAVLRDEEVGGGGGGTEVHGADLARIIRLHLTTPAPVTDIVHVSDRYITQREVVRLAREISGRRGPLPPQPNAPPANPLVCKRLTEMGGELGGAAALEATVAELVRAVAATEATRRDSV